MYRLGNCKLAFALPTLPIVSLIVVGLALNFWRQRFVIFNTYALECTKSE